MGMNMLLMADVSHARTRPKRNAFHYGVYYLCFALDDLGRLGNRLLSLNRWNLFGFYERDHGALGKAPLSEWIRGVLSQYDISQAGDKIVLLTMPRLLGYAFNPVSFWFCLDAQGGLRAVLSEVRNTFGDRHCYLSFHDDRRAIARDDILCAEKIFHVSPFIEVTGHYKFRFDYREDKIGVWIDYYDENGLMLTTSLTGKRTSLTSPRLLYCFVRYPFVTFKVVALIHYQAVRLWLKGIRYLSRPTPPSQEISR